MLTFFSIELTFKTSLLGKENERGLLYKFKKTIWKRVGGKCDTSGLLLQASAQWAPKSRRKGVQLSSSLPLSSNQMASSVSMGKSLFLCTWLKLEFVL